MSFPVNNVVNRTYNRQINKQHTSVFVTLETLYYDVWDISLKCEVGI